MLLCYCCAICDLRPTVDPDCPSRSFSSIELLCLSGLSIEFMELRVFWICSYCFRLILLEFGTCWFGAVYPGPSFRLKLTPELNWYTFIIDVFLFDWSIFAVLATKPLLLGPLPWAVPIAVPSWPSYVLPSWPEFYCWRVFSDPALTVPAWWFDPKPAGLIFPAPPPISLAVYGCVLPCAAADPCNSSTLMVFACFFLWPPAGAVDVIEL